MGANDSLHQLYEKLMNPPHRLGVPLYKPTSTLLMRPGSVGYFNDRGDWAPITQLDDLEDLEHKGFKPPEEDLERVEHEPITTWDRKYSKGVKESTASVETEVKSETLPAGASLTLEYKSSMKFGAVLITESPVHRDAYYHESPFTKWVKDNLPVLTQYKLKKEIKKYGLCIITDIYSTKKCSLNAWWDSSTTVQVDFKVNALGEIDVGAGGGWSVQRSAGGWNHYMGKKSTSEKDTGEKDTGEKGTGGKGPSEKVTGEKGPGEKGPGGNGTVEKGTGGKGTDRNDPDEYGHNKNPSPGEEVVVFASGFKFRIVGRLRDAARALGASGVSKAPLYSTRSDAEGVENTTGNTEPRTFDSSPQSIDGEDVMYEITADEIIAEPLGLPGHKSETEETAKVRVKKDQADESEGSEADED